MVSFGNTTFLIKGEGATYDITCSVITNSNMTSFKRFESKPVVKIVTELTLTSSIDAWLMFMTEVISILLGNNTQDYH
jgi:hypothetical protein